MDAQLFLAAYEEHEEELHTLVPTFAQKIQSALARSKKATRDLPSNYSNSFATDISRRCGDTGKKKKKNLIESRIQAALDAEMQKDDEQTKMALQLMQEHVQEHEETVEVNMDELAIQEHTEKMCDDCGFRHHFHERECDLCGDAHDGCCDL